MTDEVDVVSNGAAAPETRLMMAKPDPRPSSPAEKSVGTLVLIFFMDEARRAVPSVIVEAGGSRFAIVGGPATIVPDGVAPAQDGAYLEVAGQAPLVATYDSRSTVDLMVHALADQVGVPVSNGNANPEVPPARSFGDLGVWNPADRVEVAVGESLSAMGPHTRMRVQPDAAVVTALNRTVKFTPPALKTPRTHRGLIQVNRALPEGTVLFKQGRLAGIVILGRRFFGKESGTAYAIPAQRIAELCEVSLGKSISALPVY